MNAEIRGDAVIDFPVKGECWVLNPPGHSRWAFDILTLEPGSGAVADGGLWRYLTGRLHSRDVSGWARPVLSPVDGEVVVGHDSEPDRDRLVPGATCRQGSCSDHCCSVGESRRWPEAT
jgi:hypothetical protein